LADEPTGNLDEEITLEIFPDSAYSHLVFLDMTVMGTYLADNNIARLLI